MASLFHEELGYVLEVDQANLAQVEATLNEQSVNFLRLGVSTTKQVLHLAFHSHTSVHPI